MELEITSLARLEELRTALPCAAVLFSGPDCSICHAIKPRLRALTETEFPKITLLHVDIATLPSVAPQYNVTTIPTLILYFTGKEHHRFIRVFGIDEVKRAITRPYDLLFQR